jgi:hypothetical protein
MEYFYASFIYMDGRYFLDESIKSLSPIKKGFTNAKTYEVTNVSEVH